ncbi:MAG: hypothetical protein AAGO57_09810, partial [Pseudomonadota bacterium]
IDRFVEGTAEQAGGKTVRLGIMLLESGPLAVLEGIGVWVFAQLIILPIALLSMPIGALIRMILGLSFDQPRPVALVSGALVGLSCSLLFALSTKDGWSAWPPIISVGLVAGIAGGWTWWRVERTFLKRQEPTSHP